MTARSPHCERYESCFIHGGGVQDLLLATRIKGKIDATADAAAAGETGNYIRIALYNWYSSGGGQEIAASLARAQKSGVSVRVVVGPADDGLMSYLTSKGVGVTPCAKSCMHSGSGAMHNKCFLIQKGDTKLVIQSSGNLKDTQATHAQNLLISRDDAALFSAPTTGAA
ncbi:phospholipase D-like domain-containing protein [Streptomyces sp. NRRL B-3229]|uniref:phospholipase D-like domain-containing protein n=1 Tax=Streptomyces sp. NRRL B-3229 TaxID=1463836 RepID=UPI000690671B|nr:phospholipase D-like domain-containing protein [Streptomyces sp. NRRL B-3229]